MAKCKECGYELQGNEKTCPQCGCKTQDIKGNANMTNRFIFFLAICFVVSTLSSAIDMMLYGFNIIALFYVIAEIYIAIGLFKFNNRKSSIIGIVGTVVFIICVFIQILSKFNTYSDYNDSLIANESSAAYADANPEEFVETETVETETVEKEDSETAAKRNILGTYQFGEYGANCEITINEDGTCTMFEEQTPKYLWHGTWKYHEWSDYNCYKIQWSSCDNPLLHLPFTSKINYINEGINYIYANMTAMEAKDPNARYELNRR